MSEDLREQLLQIKIDFLAFMEQIHGALGFEPNLIAVLFALLIEGDYITQDRIMELQEEPEFQWSRDRITYAVDGGGDPMVKLTLGNVPLDYDLWEGLRNPAVVGLYPAGLREIWEFHANRTKDRVDEYGRQTIFQVAHSFDEAREKYGRALIASVMLPFSPSIVEGYYDQIKEDKDRSSHAFIRMYEDVNLMINKATNRVALELSSSNTVVVAMGEAPTSNTGPRPRVMG